MATAMELAASGVVVGMKELTGSVETRVDIDVMVTEQPDTFNLMLLALAAMQHKSEVLAKLPGLEENDILSYYSIAGIHGLPQAPWDKVQNKFNKFTGQDSDMMGGYCPHGLLIFPTWHRPYMMLIEQTIYLNMVQIAGRFDPPHRERYLKAANAFRLPYLDYFRARDDRGVLFPSPLDNSNVEWRKYDFRLPDVLNEPGINVKFPPLDTIEEISNPLYSYKFTEGGQIPEADWNVPDLSAKRYTTAQTVRWAPKVDSTEHGLKALSNSLNQRSQAGITSFFDLTTTVPYESFEAVASDKLLWGSLTSKDGRPFGKGSIEGFHGNYHMNIGGFRGSGNNETTLGHMSDVPVSAFDPVFWLHHCQIDRVWSLWRGFHSKAWFPEPKNQNEQSDAEKDLLPFYKGTKGKFFNSNDTKDTTVLGYRYDDDDFIGDPEKLKQRLEDKYGWMRVQPGGGPVGEPKDFMKPLYNEVHASYFMTGLKDPKTSTPPVPDLTTSDRSSRIFESFASAPTADIADTAVAAPPKINPIFDREWYVDSAVLRSAANGPFTIFFYLSLKGELPTDDVAALAQSPFLAGINHLFVASTRVCDNCGDLAALGQISSDTTPITPLLLRYLDREDNDLESLRPEHVKPFLVKYLRWRVVFNGNEIKDPRELAQHAHLEIAVSAKVYHDDGSKTYEDYPDVVQQIKANASPTAGI